MKNNILLIFALLIVSHYAKNLSKKTSSKCVLKEQIVCTADDYIMVVKVNDKEVTEYFRNTKWDVPVVAELDGVLKPGVKVEIIAKNKSGGVANTGKNYNNAGLLATITYPGVNGSWKQVGTNGNWICNNSAPHTMGKNVDPSNKWHAYRKKKFSEMSDNSEWIWSSNGSQEIKCSITLP